MIQQVIRFPTELQFDTLRDREGLGSGEVDVEVDVIDVGTAERVPPCHICRPPAILAGGYLTAQSVGCGVATSSQAGLSITKMSYANPIRRCYKLWSQDGRCCRGIAPDPENGLRRSYAREGA
jgi:hypothetical protein